MLDADAAGSRRLIDQVFEKHRIDVRVTQQTGHTHTAFRMVEAGLGSSVTPGLSLPESAQLVTRPLVPVVKRAIALVRRRNRSLSPLAELVWNRLRELAASPRGAPARA